MDNSEKLSLFRKGYSKGFGFVDIEVVNPVNTLRSCDDPPKDPPPPPPEDPKPRPSYAQTALNAAGVGVTGGAG